MHTRETMIAAALMLLRGNWLLIGLIWFLLAIPFGLWISAWLKARREEQDAAAAREFGRQYLTPHHGRGQHP